MERVTEGEMLACLTPDEWAITTALAHVINLFYLMEANDHPMIKQLAQLREQFIIECLGE